MPKNGGETHNNNGSFLSRHRVLGEHDLKPASDAQVRTETFEARLDSAARGSLTACDLMDAGLVVCDTLGRVVAANRCAVSVLRAGNGLSVNSNGELSVTRERPQQPTLRDLVARALAGKQPSAIVIPRSINEPGLTVIVRGRDRLAGTRLPGDPAVFVLILDPSLQAKPGLAQVRELFGLTSSELRLAELLIDGRSLNECCDQLAISRSKGCQHLKSLFRKTGVRRQSHLIALLLEYVPAQPAARADLTASLPTLGPRRRATTLAPYMRHRR